MGKVNELEQKIRLLNEEKERLEQAISSSIKEVIEECVKEQKINRISKHIFTIRFSQMIGNSWNPSFYDWEASSKLLLDYLCKLKPKKWRSELQSLYDKRNGNRVDLPYKVKVWFNSYRTEKIPVSAEFVKSIIDKL